MCSKSELFNFMYLFSFQNLKSAVCLLKVISPLFRCFHWLRTSRLLQADFDWHKDNLTLIMLLVLRGKIFPVYTNSQSLTFSGTTVQLVP